MRQMGNQGVLKDILLERLKQLASEWLRKDEVLAPLLEPILSARKLAPLLASTVAAPLSAGSPLDLGAIFEEAYENDARLVSAARSDLEQTFSGEAAVSDILTPFLFFPGFHALQAHRQAHRLWRSGRFGLAHHIQSLSIRLHGADIHPGAQIEPGVVLSHSNGVVIGETAEIGQGVVIRQNVTLGSKYRQGGLHHPLVGPGVTIGAGASILGRITIGENAVIGAGAVVVDPVSPGETVVGFAARPLRSSRHGQPVMPVASGGSNG